MRRVKFFTMTGVGNNDYDGEHTVEILNKEISDWLEIADGDVSYLWSELSKSYKVDYPNRLVMVEDIRISQKEANISIEIAKSAIEKARQKEKERKKKAKEKKEQKKAQTLAEKKKMYEQLRKEFEEEKHSRQIRSVMAGHLDE